MNPAPPTPPADPRQFRERRVIPFLCLLAGVHVFIFSAAFPFFNNVDEQIHFDLTIKYSQGHVPRALESVSNETVDYIVLYGSPEYLGVLANLPDGKFPPPPWTQPLEQIRPFLIAKTASWRAVTNYEASQPPLYYSLGGSWWHLGRLLDLEGGQRLYWLRFLNILTIVTLVWLGHRAARLVFPENFFLQVGVPALIAFFPQTAFYSIQNDALSAVCFGAAFIFLVKFLRAELPSLCLGILTGLLLAATFLTKISNLPLLAISALVILFKTTLLAQAGKIRAARPSLIALALCAGLPMLLWLAWCKHTFGDFSGTAAKIHFLGWTHKPFGEWWHHPLFTLHGLWTFLSGLLATFWQGEFMWHRQTLNLWWADWGYAIVSLVLLSVAAVNLRPRYKTVSAPQRQALWLAGGCLAAAVAFLGFLSIIYDFQDCFYPSRAHPYFTSGRLMLGALVPFLLLVVFGLDRALGKFSRQAKFSVLAVMLLAMLVSETVIAWPVFFNGYNWFHL